ncbi:protein jagunal homolog 1-like [Oscarella lobularis]|uniref:protein jagunal homolog 1-like n=1 Tax=Oscarella lobularis TaxID=121494 RepID=UPI0033131B96
MSSREGPRAAGTDGSDFSHRQRVASHYSRIVEAKWRMRLVLIIHVVLGACVGLQAIVSSRGLQLIPIWEWTWLVGCLSCLVGFAALKRNNVKMLKVFMALLLALGVAPVAVGLSLLAVHRPIAMADLYMLMVAIAAGFTHVLEIIVGRVLLESWDVKGEKNQ